MAATDAVDAVVYYTLDGSDPRLRGGLVSQTAIAYTSPVTVNQLTTVKARVKDANGWSPLREAEFYPAGHPRDLQISEILYAPMGTNAVDGKRLEFVEIRNSGPARISLDQIRISGGIDFVFPSGLFLDPGEHTVVVSDEPAFVARNDSVRVAGEYSGNLSNSGERITLGHSAFGTIQQVVYSNWFPWPQAAHTLGHSLIPVDLSNRGRPTQSTAWMASRHPGGTPGTARSVDPNWIEDEILGWIYSDTGEMKTGDWLYSTIIGWFYFGSESPSGRWFWVLK